MADHIHQLRKVLYRTDLGILPDYKIIEEFRFCIACHKIIRMSMEEV